eukprot:m.284718 g.284718  ORF g.284718 m.284718 type:complete len:290 (+) comp177261_c0_seq1:110-979(+)
MASDSKSKVIISWSPQELDEMKAVQFSGHMHDVNGWILAQRLITELIAKHHEMDQCMDKDDTKRSKSRMGYRILLVKMFRTIFTKGHAQALIKPEDYDQDPYGMWRRLCSIYDKNGQRIHRAQFEHAIKDLVDGKAHPNETATDWCTRMDEARRTVDRLAKTSLKGDTDLLKTRPTDAQIIRVMTTPVQGIDAAEPVTPYPEWIRNQDTLLELMPKAKTTDDLLLTMLEWMSTHPGRAPADEFTTTERSDGQVKKIRGDDDGRKPACIHELRHVEKHLNDKGRCRFGTD